MRKNGNQKSRTPHVVTIGGGNGHSNILGAIQKTFLPNIDLSAIVSMSDDGRTTGRLMRHFEDNFGIHFPPPGDVRRCLYFLSNSAFREDFEKYFELVIQDDELINELTLGEIAKRVGAYEFLSEMNFPYLGTRLPIKGSLEGHKFGNIVMGFLFHHFHSDYEKMVEFMHEFLMVDSHVIPVTTDRAYIQAHLTDGTIIEKQDRISNDAGYDARIAKLSLMPGSETATHNGQIADVLHHADYIILTPGDLYTSTISNLIIGDVARLIQQSWAKIIFIANTTNKWGETQGYTLTDFIEELEEYLGKRIDIVISNSRHLDLSDEELKILKNSVSVKGWEYIYPTDEERQMLIDRGTRLIETDIVDRKTLYKHDQSKIAKILEKIIFHDFLT